MKLICPHCQQSVAVADETAGGDTSCPACGRSFPVPARYQPVVLPSPLPAVPPTSPIPPTVPPAPEVSPMSSAPTVDRPAPPPGFVPPQLSPTPVPPPGYTKSVSVVLSPRVIAWLPSVCLGFTLVFTFFTWVASYFDHPVFSQNAWQDMAGDYTRAFKMEDVAKQTFPDFSKWLNLLTSDWLLMFPYLLLLIFATALAWADRLMVTLPTQLPRWLGFLPRIWPHRASVLMGLATISLILVLTQAINGFGMERAIRSSVANSQKITEARQKAGQSRPEQDSVDRIEKQKLDEYDLRRTTWFYLAVGLHVVAVLGFVAGAVLARRGDKPAPRLVLQY